MPEQQGRRTQAITSAPFEIPFETPVSSLGLGGLHLQASADKIPATDFRRLTNLVHQQDGQLTVRPGVTALTAVQGSVHHSVRRLNDPTDSTFTRLYGVGTTLAHGTTTPLVIDTGYSGDPLTFVPYRPPLSGETWMFVADRSRMRKVSAAGLDLPIGLPAPGASLSTAAQAQGITPICAFDATDGSAAAAWTGVAGWDYSVPPLPTGVPTTLDYPGIVGTHIEFKTAPGAAVATANKGYYSFWSLPKTLNLSLAGAATAADEDLIHLYLKLSHPSLTAEVRVYLVCSSTFVGSVLPGTDAAGNNGDFYVKGFRGNDFANALQAQQALVDAAEVARQHTLRDDDLQRRQIVGDRRAAWENARAERDVYRAKTVQAGSGVQQWVQYGVLGVPLRRGDFQRVGSSSDRGWQNITGIIIYIQTVAGTSGEVACYLDDTYLAGGAGPDSSEPGAQQYDYRYTHYDPRTGAEGNPSPVQPDASQLDLLRQACTLTPVASGLGGSIRQRFYRRGGSLTADWYYLGQNTSNGGVFVDTEDDAGIAAADTVELDNYEACPSIDAAGATVEAQPHAVLFGPVEDLLFALGDPLQPGHVKFCKPGRPDSWPPENSVEVCSPSEELMTGGVYAGQAFCLSRERYYLLYPSLTSGATTVTAVPGACMKGLVSRWGLAVGRGGVYFVAEDGIYQTTGGPETRLSEAIAPLFQGQTVEGYLPVDLTDPTTIRLALHDWDLWFFYADTGGTRRALVLSLLYKTWRAVAWNGPAIAHGYSDEGAGADVLLLGGASSGVTYTHAGLTDAGTGIAYLARTADHDFGRPREDKLFGDVILDLDANGTTPTLTTRLNNGATVNAVQTLASGVGRARVILDSFGTLPQKARTLAAEIAGTSAAAPPIFYQIGASIIPQPDVTVQRVTQWDDCGHPSEVYLTGLRIDVDTGSGAKEFYVEYDLDGVWNTLGPFAVAATNRHVYFFTWSAVKAHLIRIRPIGDCVPWMLYRADWIFDPEPPRIAGWDINHENGWDQYCTGLDLECDTFGVGKTVEVYIDQTLIQTYAVAAAGRRVVHLTIQPPVRGHVLRFVATDANPGLLYSHRWHTDVEPSEQTNWNQNYSIAGTLGDKWLKAVIFECDTFSQQKTVTLEVDGVVVETLLVQTAGRRVVEFAFAQHLGQVFRILPTDNYPSRLYSHQLIFDQEPFKFTRWETQEVTHGIQGWQVPYAAHVTLKAAVDVTLTVTSFRQDGSALVRTYTIPATVLPSGGLTKIKRYVPFQATKGVLFKYVLTASQAFWLYREETEVHVAAWGRDQTAIVRPFGNDDQDPTRGMINATLASARAGGGL
jgi:hypothetical protein